MEGGSVRSGSGWIPEKRRGNVIHLDRIGMFGTGLELQEIKETVDSLSLSALCEYEIK